MDDADSWGCEVLDDPEVGAGQVQDFVIESA